MYIKTNSIELFYEKTGRGEPIILLHGNGEDHHIFDVLTTKLVKSHTVYAIDSRGHGKSSKTKVLNYSEMMEDIASFIRGQKIERPILYGFSDGGIIGLLMTIKYPDILSKLIISGANLSPSGIKKKWLLLLKVSYFFTRGSKIKLMLTQPDIKVSDLSKITTPTVVLAGSNEFCTDEHTRLIAAHIPGSKLEILAGENHASYVLNNEKLYEILIPYL
ncbi:MAG: alpha/beta hydrolase [Lachnospiraceae bacterium]|nr:alpha/beta hydrolase [Lachnospiraceae bacterium]